MTYLTASTSVRLGGGVWVEFMRPCTHMSSVYSCRYGLKLKREFGLGVVELYEVNLQTHTGDLRSKVT